MAGFGAQRQGVGMSMQQGQGLELMCEGSTPCLVHVLQHKTGCWTVTPHMAGSHYASHTSSGRQPLGQSHLKWPAATCD